MGKILVISTIDYLGEWYVAGVATTPEAAMEALRKYWEAASREHPSNPNYTNWRLVPQSAGLPEIHAIDPRYNEDRGWSLQEYDIWQ